MIKEFIYTSSNGIKERKVLVIKENDQYIGGLDLNLLSKDEVDTILNLYKDLKPTNDFKSKIQLDGFNQSWNRAYRQFLKYKINNK